MIFFNVMGQHLGIFTDSITNALRFLVPLTLFRTLGEQHLFLQG